MNYDRLKYPAVHLLIRFLERFNSEGIDEEQSPELLLMLL